MFEVVLSPGESVAVISSEVAARVRAGDDFDHACTAIGRRFGLSRVAVARLSVTGVRAGQFAELACEAEDAA